MTKVRTANEASGGDWRRWTIAAVIAAEVLLILKVVDPHYPVRRWLFWVYLELWTVSLAWALACVVGGHSVVKRLRLPLREHVFMSFACGVLVFGLGVFVFGLFGLLGTPFFVAWPLLLAAPGARSFARLVVRAYGHIRWKTAMRPPTFFSRATLLFGAGGVLLLYANILLPENIGYDSRWYHLGIAEHYVAAGRVTRFPEGWFMGAYPHLSSFVYTWAFLFSNSTFSRVELAAHLEFVLFCATLAGIPLLVETLVPKTRASWSWAVTFLFPGILLYDSSLIAAADHVLAFWSVPLALAFRRARRTHRPAEAALFGAMLAAAALTKYQAALLIAVPSAAFAFSCARTAATGSPGERVRPLLTLGAAAGAALALSSPHWLKNFVWYGDPFYPMLRDHLSVRPWTAGIDPDFVTPGDWRASGPLLDRILASSKAAVTFAFEPHDWARFHGDFPVFGFLFTCSLGALPFLRGTRAIWQLAVWSLIGVSIWFFTYHQDRYLQALLPWMVAVTAATFIRIWKVGGVARPALAALIAIQIIWGGDVYFYPTHAMLGTAPIKALADLLAMGFRKKTNERFEWKHGIANVGARLPPRAKVLFHDAHNRFGIQREVVTDALGTQGGIVYSVLGSPRGVYDRLKEYGVTHIVWDPKAGTDNTIADELVFSDFVCNHTSNRRTIGGWSVSRMPGAPPSQRGPALVAVTDCKGFAKVPLAEVDGVVKSLAKKPPSKALAEVLGPDLGDVTYWVAPAGCDLDSKLTSDFTKGGVQSGQTLWVRTVVEGDH